MGLPKHQDHFYLKNVKKRIVKAYVIGKILHFLKNKLETIFHI